MRRCCGAVVCDNEDTPETVNGWDVQHRRQFWRHSTCRRWQMPNSGQTSTHEHRPAQCRSRIIPIEAKTGAETSRVMNPGPIYPALHQCRCRLSPMHLEVSLLQLTRDHEVLQLGVAAVRMRPVRSRSAVAVTSLALIEHQLAVAELSPESAGSMMLSPPGKPSDASTANEKTFDRIRVRMAKMRAIGRLTTRVCGLKQAQQHCWQ